uniref:Ig-like domain-containing protein n=1 Tax=Acanthochromis polyacanthus TaxID=80966 RepID=A0A3Q1HMH4_9TELE
FRYVVTGDPLPEVQWLKGSFHIQPSGFCITVNNPDGSGFINLKSVRQEHSDVYTCKASNQYGEASCTAELLVFREVMLSDGGNYTCEVLNESGCESCSIKVTVKGLVSVEAVRGSVAVLECEISGSAPFEVTWKKNKKRLSADKKFRIVSQGCLSSLEIHSFESADVGEYECVVSNEVGKVSDVLLAVYDIIMTNPVISEPPIFSKRVESATAVLQLNAPHN